MSAHAPQDDTQQFQNSIEAIGNDSPKRTYPICRQGNPPIDVQNQEQELSQGAKIRVSHELIFKKICAKRDVIIEEHGPNQQFQAANGDLYLTTTEDESRLNSSFSSIKQSQADKEESQGELEQIRLEESINQDQNQSYQEEKVENQSKESSDQQVEQGQQQEPQSTSILFIPFSKDQAQLLADKELQEYLIKVYTPLQYHQIFPWMTEQIKTIEDPIIRLHQEIIEFYKYIKPSKRQKEARKDILQHIRSIIVGLYPKAQVQAFGSYACELYLPDGDIDIVALIDHETLGREKTMELYAKIYQEFRKNHRNTYKEIKFIKSARIPLVKMVHKQTNFSIDVSLNVCSGLNQIQNLNAMKRKYPEFKYLILVLKMMLKIRNLNETFCGGVGSFLLVCMLYHYLRDFHFTSKILQVKRYSLTDYLLGFFTFYFMKVDFYSRTINVRSGMLTVRKRKQKTLSMLSPCDESIDIGKKATKMSDILELFKNRTRVLKEKLYPQGESLLKEIINPAMKQFEYYERKQRYMAQQGDEPEQQEPPYEQEKVNCEIMSEEQRKQQENYLRNINNQEGRSNYKNRRIHRVNRAGYNRKDDNKDDLSGSGNDGKNDNSSQSY